MGLLQEKILNYLRQSNIGVSRNNTGGTSFLDEAKKIKLNWDGLSMDKVFEFYEEMSEIFIFRPDEIRALSLGDIVSDVKILLNVCIKPPYFNNNQVRHPLKFLYEKLKKRLEKHEIVSFENFIAFVVDDCLELVEQVNYVQQFGEFRPMFPSASNVIILMILTTTITTTTTARSVATMEIMKLANKKLIVKKLLPMLLRNVIIVVVKVMPLTSVNYKSILMQIMILTSVGLFLRRGRLGWLKNLILMNYLCIVP